MTNQERSEHILLLERTIEITITNRVDMKSVAKSKSFFRMFN